MCGVTLFPYQKEIADRILFSLIMGDAEDITVLCSRQAGKTEVLACTAATAMVLLPRLAQAYPTDPILAKYRNGLMVGVFGPVEFQSKTIYNRICARFDSNDTKAILADPELDESSTASGNTLRLRKCRSFCTMQTAHPTAKIESSTYHLIIIDEAQDADPTMVRKSIHPMTVATGGTICNTGTSTSHKSSFYDTIQHNKRRNKTHGKKNHLEFDWRHAARANPFYAQSIKKEKERIGEDSDEFQMSYELRWLLDRGMFITEDQIEALGDPELDIVSYYTDTPIVIGVDVASKHDSTVVTALWVDWDHPDEFGLFTHRILAWLELHGENWETQYREICEFASRYRVMRMGVDAQGMGGPVAERLQVLLPSIEVVALPMNPVDQTERWQHLMQLIQREMIGWPATPAAKRTREYKRFTQQLGDVEKEYRGKYLLVGAPKSEKNAHDDYIDSLALAAWLSKEFGQELSVEEWSNNPLLERHSFR